MKPVRLTAENHVPIRINPAALIAWMPAPVEVDGVSFQGSMIVVVGSLEPRKVQEICREIDALFEEAMAERVDVSGAPVEVPPAG